ncbi:MAG: NrfD/PsrC family molybdoenzyme membrane anchor subunit [bacterium]
MPVKRKSSLVQDVCWFIVGAAATVLFFRYWRGLGSVTALDDITPWGLGIVFDVACGIALAAGGFTIAMVVYVFQIERFKPVARLAVLSACLGYGLYCVGLAFDMGRPERFWHILIYPQHHSVLFEVAWCVILYMTVLGLEFGTVLFEGMRWRKLEKIFKAITIPVVIAGVALSTLHQSSLGALFLIMKGKLDPLWHTQFLPLFFLLSAIAAGLMVVSLLVISSSHYWGRKFDTQILSPLARAASIILSVYLILKLVELASRGQLARIFEGSFNSNLFFAEILIGALIPAVLFLFPQARVSKGFFIACASMVVIGTVLNRMNIGLLGILWSTGSTYIPTWMEFTYSIGLVALGVILFTFIVRYFPVLGDPQDSHRYAQLNSEGDRELVLPGQPSYARIARTSMVVVIAMALTTATLPSVALHGRVIREWPVKPSGNWEQLLQNPNWTMADVPDAFTLDGDGMGKDVKDFPHLKHTEENGGRDSCAKCHCGERQGFVITRDQDYYPCAVCHADMFRETDVTQIAQLPPPGQPGGLAADAPSGMAMGLKEAMHKRCIECHTNIKGERNIPDMDECTFCHR